MNPFTRPQVYTCITPEWKREPELPYRSMGSRHLLRPILPPTGSHPAAQWGAQCRGLRVTLRVGSFEDGITSLDHEATWLLGHTGKIDLSRAMGRRGRPVRRGHASRALPASRRATAARAVPRARLFEAHSGGSPAREPQQLQLGGNRFVVVHRARNASASFRFPPARCRCSKYRRRGHRCKSLRDRLVPHRRQHPQSRLLPRPSDRDHVHADAADGWRRWCAHAARRISARSIGRETTRWRWR